MVEFAGFWRRLIAYFIDVIPITVAVAAVAYAFFGFDESVHRYLNRNRGDMDARAEFLEQRNVVRYSSFLVYLLYATVLEASPLRGTLGKWLVGIVVLDRQGRRLGLGRSAARNVTKLLSYAVCCLGFLWAAWSPGKRAWHDLIAGTFVVCRRVRDGGARLGYRV